MLHSRNSLPRRHEWQLDDLIEFFERPVTEILAGSNGHEAGGAGGQVTGISIRESTALHTGRSLPTSDCVLLIPHLDLNAAS
jgi:hypothetical protein